MTTSSGIFWLHISSFAIYNALIGYLLVHREEQDMRGLLLFSIAMAVHFLVNDYGLRQHHKDTYRDVADGCWRWRSSWAGRQGSRRTSARQQLVCCSCFSPGVW